MCSMKLVLVTFRQDYAYPLNPPLASSPRILRRWNPVATVAQVSKVREPPRAFKEIGSTLLN